MSSMLIFFFHLRHHKCFFFYAKATTFLTLRHSQSKYLIQLFGVFAWTERDASHIISWKKMRRVCPCINDKQNVDSLHWCCIIIIFSHLHYWQTFFFWYLLGVFQINIITGKKENHLIILLKSGSTCQALIEQNSLHYVHLIKCNVFSITIYWK
jgi:hypothetical protein